MLRIAAASWFSLALLAQAPVPPAPAPTAATPELPALGAPAPLPDGAPPHLTLVERDGLRTHAYWLADDARQGRYTGSKAQQATAKYVADHFQKLGLKPLGDKKGFLQTFPLNRVWLDPVTSLQFGTTKVTGNFAVLPAGRDDKVSLSGKFAFCGGGRGDEVKGDLKGKIAVVALTKAPRGGGAAADVGAVNLYRDIARKLAGAGASAAVVCLLDNDSSLANTLNYHALLPDHAALSRSAAERGQALSVPLFLIPATTSAALLAHLHLDGTGAGTPDEKATGKLQITVKSDDKGSSSNIVAVLEGKGRKQEAVVFSAHHDHVGQRLDGDSFNGADDNASGTAGLLEIAEAFAKGGDRPERSIVFLSVSGEELGLWGSAWFADHPTWPLDKIVADVNIDMIGRATEASGKTVIGVTPSNSHGKYSTMVREAHRLADLLGMTFTSGDQYYERSDHFNFAKKGVPVVFFCDGEHPDYHQVTDHADKLDYPKMEQVARLAFWTGWQVANGKDKPKDLGPQNGW
ncbi:MAG: M20/M25/M40 family metallo-hydrolase [Planctomycetes bacterium]|nr:M20/M25/M40 family metallo-hydrolase [Planctomycetota bacterium]